MLSRNGGIRGCIRWRICLWPGSDSFLQSNKVRKEVMQSLTIVQGTSVVAAYITR
jgi:hypothetical protein